ncbi:hypothetical protein JCM10449v2_007110 [Rhodotorula kratochvilovae]
MKARSDSHDSAFGPSKTDAVLYLPPNQRRPDHLPRVLPRGVPVAYAPSLTMLGTEIDEKLAFSPLVPLHCALLAFPLLTPTLCVETLLPDPIAPWALEPAINACIDQTKEKACEMHLAKISSLPSESILVYSDGLLLDGRAGAGVVSRVVLEDDEDGEGLL